MSTVYASKGAQVKHGSSATPTDVLAGIRDVALTGGERGQIDAVTHDSANIKSWLPNPLTEPRVLEITIAYDPADTGHEAIRAAHLAKTLWYMTFVAPDAGAAQWALAGYILDFTVPTLNPSDGVLEATIRFVANAAETFTA